MYMIYCDGYEILDKPISLEELIATFGMPEALRQKGFRIVRVTD
jgi:hypothetical protein